MAQNNNHFGLILDTVAPSGSISAKQYYSYAGTITIESDDASKMKVWLNHSATATKEDADYPTEWEAFATSKATAFSEQGTYYYHMVLVDAVGNESEVINSTAIGYETSGPKITSLTINNGDTYTTSRTGNTITFTFEKNIAPIGWVGIVSQNITTETATITLTEEELAAGTATRTIDFKDTAEEGQQTIMLSVYSAAGNNGARSASIILDLDSATGTLSIRDAENTQNISGYINYTNVGVRIDCTSDDWKSYSISGPFVGSPITSDVTAEQLENNYVFNTITLTSVSELKTLSAYITDNAGHVTQLTEAVVTLDIDPPTASLTTDTTRMSEVAGYTEANLAVTVADLLSGVSSWKISVQGSSVVLAEGTSLTEEVTITYDQLPNEGDNILELSVSDNAGNITTQTVTIVLDTTAPVITVAPTITNKNGYIGGTVDSSFVSFQDIVVSASATDTTGILGCGCWIDGVSTASQLPSSGATYFNTYKTSFTYDECNVTAYVEGGNNYAHVYYKDNFGHTTFATTSVVIIDTTRPASGSITGLATVCHKATQTININPSDVNISAGKGWYKIWGDITTASSEETAEWNSYATSAISITFTGDENSTTKTINVKWRDAAGNIQTDTVASVTTELDTKTPIATLVLCDSTNTTVIDNKQVSNNTFVARISGTDDSDTGIASAYLLYGKIKNFQESLMAYSATTSYALGNLVINTVDGQEQIRMIKTPGAYATWEALCDKSSDAFHSLTYDEGKTYFTTNVLTASDGDGTKNIYLKVRDNAGNVSDVVMKYFILDTSAPTVNIDSHDREIISKKHVKIDTSTTPATTYTEKQGYADYVTFQFSPSEKVIAWKVCAYNTQADAEAGTHADSAIPTTNGSINMEGAGIEESGSIVALINGADYELALGGASTTGEHDGAHFIVVYVQDDAGTWSGSAIFA